MRAFLLRAGLADDIEFRASGSEDRAICLVRGDRRSPLGDEGEGPRRLVLVAVTLLYLPWGSHLLLEGPEDGLDPEHQASMAELLRLISGMTGAAILAETRSADFVRSLGPFRPPKGETGAGPSPKVEGLGEEISLRESEDGAVRVIELTGKRKRETS